MRQTYSAAEKASHLRALEASNLGPKAYAQAHGLSVSALFRWKSEAAKQRRESVAAKAAFARVEVVKAELGLLVRVAGAEIAVQRGFDRELLREVVAALGAKL